MPKSKKKFIDRKNAVSFHVVHRSQQDPLVADETAPQHVLVAAADKRSKQDVDKQKEDQKKFGVFYDDDYNYLQHLKDANTLTVEWEPVERFRIPRTDPVPTKLPGSGAAARLQLPSSVFASEAEEDIGLLNKAAPQTGLRLDLDPDVVAAMDEDFDFSDPENELEDDFIEMANADKSDDEDADYEDCDSNEGDFADVSSGDEDDDGSMKGPQYTFNDEETKTRFTNYSMSSSVMRRTEQLSILDGRFEHMYAGYDDAEIGALDCEEIEGHVAPDDPSLLAFAEQFKKERTLERPETNRDKSMLGRYLATLPESDEEDQLVDLEMPDQAEKKWDCQSIISTYSNIYNHPKLIAEPKGTGRIRICPRTGMPLGVLDGKDGKLTVKALAKLDATNQESAEDDSDEDGAETVFSTLSLLSIRPKDESPADRLERKKALKEYRKERRLEKKANAMAFKEEKKRQEKVLLNNKKNQQVFHMV